MFYEQLKQACKNKNTSVTAVLKKIGIGTANGTYWKNGSVPASDTVVQLAEFLNVTTDYLLTGKEIQPTTLTTDEQELLKNYSKLTDTDKKEVSARTEELANGIVSESYGDRQNTFKPVYYSDLREKEMLMLFRSLSKHEQERLIGRAELLVEQAKLEENAG